MVPVTRRDCVKVATVSAVTAGLWCSKMVRAAQQSASLKDAAAAKGIRYGALADINLKAAPPAYRDLFQQQCGLCAVDVWAPAFSKGPDAFNFATSENADILAAFECGIPITGAHLLWYYHLPNWFGPIDELLQAEDAIVTYVSKVAHHYRGKAWSWNAVNEALDPRDGLPLGLRRCWPLRTVGPSYIELTFRTARSADPEAVLCYNDSGFELHTPEHEARRRALLLLLDDLARRGTPIDAVGLQSHLRYQQFSQFDDKQYRAFLKEIASRGLKIIISELDVLDVGAPSEIGRRDLIVADIYKRFLTVALDELAVEAVVNWGLSNRYTWLNPRNDASFVRTDRLSTRPLPFDEDLRPTAAFRAMLTAFEAAPGRSKE